MRVVRLIMKKFLEILILVLFLIIPAQADDIRDFQIEGMSVGDSLLDYITKEEIMHRKKTSYVSKKFASVTGLFDEEAAYEGYLVHFKNDDPKFIIEALQGMIIFENNIQECYKLKKEIISELDKTIKNAEKKSWKKKHAADKSGKSKTDNTQYTYKSGGHTRVTCNDWSEEMSYVDKLSVSIVTKEFVYWIENEAY